jgi:CHRD domain
MKQLSIFITMMAGLLLLTSATTARGETWHATLTGYEESPPVSTVANGDFRATVEGGGTADHFHYTLTYSGLQGTVTQGHIHVGQLGVNGSIVIWLCQTATNPDPTGLSPQCPQSGTIEGRITAANVIAGSTASQQLNANDFVGALAAIRAGVAYVNVHTSPLSTGGEVRGQIRVVSK